MATSHSNRIEHCFLIALTVFTFGTSAFAQNINIFSGKPSLKVIEGGLVHVPEVLEAKTAANLKCVISEIDGKYYWASRENRQLQRYESEGFITFVADEGVGYIKIIKPQMKEMVGLLFGATEKKFDYIEHMGQGLKTVTYFGTNVTE